MMEDLGGAQILMKQRHINEIYTYVTYIECEVGSFSTKSKSFLGVVNGFLIFKGNAYKSKSNAKRKRERWYDVMMMMIK